MWRNALVCEKRMNAAKTAVVCGAEAAASALIESMQTRSTVRKAAKKDPITKQLIR